MFGIDGLYDYILIDGQHLVHRAAHAYGDLSFVDTNGNEVHTGIIYGFLRLVAQTWKNYADPNTQVVVCWEGGYKHRTALYPPYKANRREQPDEEKQEYLDVMFSQQRALQKILRVAGWSQARASGYEADDVLATLAYQHGDSNVALYTGDQDLHQCVTDKVHVVSAVPGGGKSDKIWKIADVVEKWGLEPERVPEAKALAGDSGDNIPGCPGCGLGWAKKLLDGPRSVTEVLSLAEAGVLEGTYNGKAWRAPSLTEKLAANREQVLISWELAKVVRDCPVEIDEGERDHVKLKAILERLHMFSLADGRNWERLSDVR